METTTTPASAFDRVLADVPADVRRDVARAAHRRMNAVPERPSDSARWAVALWRSGRLVQELATIDREILTAHRIGCQYGPRVCDTCQKAEATR